MKRKQLADIQGHLTAGEKQRRAAIDAQQGRFALGYPTRPEGLPRAARNLWNDVAKKLYARRLLAFTDGELLLQYVNAKQAGDTVAIERIADIFFRARTPFPVPVESAPPANAPDEEAESSNLTLADFLAAVANERATFQQRMKPGATACFDSNSEEYQWPEGDPAEVARRYALEITQGKIISGELLRRACDRFLKDLEVGHERGIYFDPVAARHICQFAEHFCNLHLMPWEVFLFSNLFSWKRATGYRRFTEALVSVAKKNGKTAIGAILGLWGLVCDQEKFADVFCSATKKEQSRLVWRDARRMVSDNEELRNHVQRWSGALAVSETDSTMTPLSSDIKSMDGTRGSTFICDELHMWADADQWHKLVKGGVSRPQPLCLAITTAGETKHCFCWNKFDLGEKILRGIYQADETFILIYSIDKGDEYRNESVWEKANPSLGVTLKIEHLRQTLAEVEQDPSGLNAFLRYHLNQWLEPTLTRQGSIPAAKWAACDGLDLFGETLSPWAATIKFLKLNTDTPCFGGLDVGLVSDLSAFAMLFPKGRFAEGAELVEKKVLIVQFFMPEVGVIEKERSWQVPLSQWAREGWIQLLPGDMCDPREIRKFILSMASQFAVREAGFDNWNAQVLCAELNDSGSLQCVAVPQTAKELTAPAREFLAAIHRQELVHFSNPCLAWHAGNVVLAENEQHGGTKPEKLSPNEKIDGISATLNAFHRSLANPYVPSPYLTRGLVLL